MIHGFSLSPRGKGGISCGEDGAFVGAIPILHRLRRNGKDQWQPRDCDDLSEEMSRQYGVPIDMSLKSGGLQVIAKALNDGEVARAQVAAVLLGIPDPPSLSKRDGSRDHMIKLIRDLDWSGMLKWDPDEHPRWPAGSADGKGGEFAPEGSEAGLTSVPSVSPSRNQRTAENNLLQPVVVHARNVPGRRSEQECDEQYAADHAICDTLPTKRDKAICRASAAERYANCLRGKPMPPLTLPEYDYALPPESPEPAPPRFPVRPPWWLPFLLLPFPAGIPA